MKTTDDVRAWVEDYMASMLERPDMYAGSPESLEELLQLLDTLRLRLLNVDDKQLFDSGYPAFLRARGFGVANFCYRKRRPPRRPSKADPALFEALCQFWSEYAKSKFTVHPVKKHRPSARRI